MLFLFLYQQIYGSQFLYLEKPVGIPLQYGNITSIFLCRQILFLLNININETIFMLHRIACEIYYKLRTLATVHRIDERRRKYR